MKRSPRNGFTLVEVLIATVILSIAVLPLLSGFLGVIRGITESEVQHRAMSSAQRMMNQILCYPWEDPAVTTTSRKDRRIGPDWDETRPAQFDDIDDWNGFRDTDPADPMIGRSVQVDYYNPLTGESLSELRPSATKRLTVFATQNGKTTMLRTLCVRPSL